MENRSVYIGVDLGGTWIRLLASWENSGEIFDKKKYPSAFLREGDRSLLENFHPDLPLPDRPGQYLLEKILEFLSALGNPTLLGIGISAPGRITAGRNFIGANTDVRFAREESGGEKGIDLTSDLKNKFPGIPIEIENDATATGHFCAHYYHEKRALPLTKTFYLTISTGIGGGGILDYPYEVGHMRSAEGFPPFIPLCGCGLRGCLEAYASGISLEKRILSLGKASRETPENFETFERYESLRLGKKVALQKGIRTSPLLQRHFEQGQTITTGEIFEEASQEGDEGEINSLEAYLVWDSATRIAQTLVSLTQLFGLEVFCIGGGVVEKNPFFLKRISDIFEKFLEGRGPMISRVPEILPPPLGEEASDYGAISLAKDRKER